MVTTPAIYYTNNLQNTITIGGESTKAYTVNLINSSGTVVLTQQATTNSNGFVSPTVSLPAGTVDGDYKIQILGKILESAGKSCVCG